MTHNIKPTNHFKKDLKIIHKRGYNLNLLTDGDLILYLTRTGTHSDLF